MEARLQVHLAAAGLTTLLLGTIVLFWSFPKLLVYVLLAVVAVLSYGALYLILAAKMDPQGGGAAPAIEDAPTPTPPIEETVAKKTPTKTSPAKKKTPKKKAATKKKTTRKKKVSS